MQPQNEAVLIVDDEEGIRSVLQAILSSVDIETFEASNANAAVELLQTHKDRITGCLLDMNLEDCAGEDLYDKLRVISPDLAVFAMSGIFGEEIKERLGSREIAGLISKPFSAGNLISILQSGLEKQP